MSSVLAMVDAPTSSISPRGATARLLSSAPPSHHVAHRLNGIHGRAFSPFGESAALARACRRLERAHAG